MNSLFLGIVALSVAQTDLSEIGSVVSPDGRIRFQIHRREVDVAGSLSRDSQMLIPFIDLGFRTSEQFKLPEERIFAFTSGIRRDQFEQVSGKRRFVDVMTTEATVRFFDRVNGGAVREIDVRVSNDGVAFRYRSPKSVVKGRERSCTELTSFRFDRDTLLHALPLNGFTTSYEKRYQAKKIQDVPEDWLLGLPLLIERPEKTFLAITEANINEYAGMYLQHSAQSLKARLSPLPGEKDTSVKVKDRDLVTPWRVILVGDSLATLVESDFVLSLNEPCAIKDTSWIKTGKTTFPWWNGFYEDKLPFTPGLNTATAKHYIDFCAEAGIPYHSLDGVKNLAWYGGKIVPYEGFSPTKGIDGLDLPEVLKYAKSKGVKIRLWMHWKAAEQHMEQAFPLYREWGIEGVMLDFMDRDDQLMNRFVRKAVALAAENKLTVTLHGCPKPTGLERTYPNLLSHEGVMNLEYDKWDKTGITPDHETTVPFTRMLAGPLDFHQGSFRTVAIKDFKARNDAPLVMGTPARTLASYVVYQNHLSMVADYPSAYRGHPATPILAAIPTTWDDTKLLDGQVGERVVMARRSGSTWHVGAFTNADARTLTVPTEFLGKGPFRITAWQDDAAAKHGLRKTEMTIVGGASISIPMSAGGGWYATIEPAAK